MSLRGAASQRDLELLREWFTSQLTNLDKVLDEREKAHDTSRQDAQRAVSEQNKAVDARLTQLNGFKAEITNERNDYARRDYVDGKLDALDTRLDDSRSDRIAIHARLEVLAAVEQQVQTNSGELITVRQHVHEIAGTQFTPAQHTEIVRLLTLAEKFQIADGFQPDEMTILHTVADSFKGKQATHLRRLSALEQVLFTVCGSGILYVIAQLVHFHPG